MGTLKSPKKHVKKQLTRKINVIKEISGNVIVKLRKFAE